MRVIAGKCRSIQLQTIEGSNTRPTTDRIKETLFNMLQPDIPGCSFLDLFSGSGAIGIEALSRGAASAFFVEQNRKAISCIQRNLEKTKLQKEAKVIAGDVIRVIKRLDGSKSFDIIFMDPPYNKELEKEALIALRSTSLVDEDTLIVVEASLETDFSWAEESYELIKIKKYKTNIHVFMQIK